MNLNSKEVELKDKRSAIDIIMVLDVSGSMGGKKIKLLKETLFFILKELNEKDRFGLVLFSDQSRLEIPLVYTTKDNKKMITKKVKAIRTGGGTNLK